MSGDRWSDLAFLAGVALTVVSIIAALAWTADREATRGRK